MKDIRAPRWVLPAVQFIRTATTVAALTTLLGLGTANLLSPPQASGPGDRIGDVAGPLDDLMETNRCSLTGFDRGVIPSTAIVRTPVGVNELVSFDQGWAVFSGEQPGDLVAVCLGPRTTTKPVAGTTH